MTNLFKVIILTAPVFALVFYYVVTRQAEHKATMDMESLQFEREWHEMAAEFSSSQSERQRHLRKVRELDRKLAEIQRREEEKQRKAEEFEKEFEQALREADQRLKEPLAPEKPTRR